MRPGMPAWHSRAFFARVDVGAVWLDTAAGTGALYRPGPTLCYHGLHVGAPPVTGHARQSLDREGSMPFWFPLLMVFLVGLVVTLLTVPLAKRIAVRLNAIDYPSARRINTKPTPRMGGAAIFCGLAAALVTQYVGTVYFGWPVVLIPHHSLSINYWLLAVSVLAVFLTGVVDDVKSLKPLHKLIGQVVAASIAAAAGLLIGNIVNPFGPGELSLGWLAYPITVVYLVAFTNIINLIDGLDGLAAGITAIASASLFVLTLMSGRLDAASLAIALCGCCLGFLRYNFHPASIFMGDSGSNTLGFLLGVIALLGVTRTAALTTLIVPLIIAGVPIIDTFAAIVRRKRGHTSISQADKGHIHNRLINRGFDQRQAVLLIYAWCILLSAGAFAITQVSPLVRVVIFLVLLGVSVAFVVKLHLFEPVLRHYYNPKTHTDTVLPVDDPVFAQPSTGKDAQDTAEADQTEQPR